jgi:hypothetical protein
LLNTLSVDAREEVIARFLRHAEVARTVLLHEPISELTMASFEHDVQRIGALAESQGVKD